MPLTNEAASLLACIACCKSVIAAFASGRATPVIPTGSRVTDLRYAPSAVRGLPPESTGVPYTLGSICTFLYAQGKDVRRNLGKSGRMAPSRWMRVAISLLEAFEEGWLDEQSTLTFIHDGRPGFGMRSLLQSLPEQRTAYLVMKESK